MLDLFCFLFSLNHTFVLKYHQKPTVTKGFQKVSQRHTELVHFARTPVAYPTSVNLFHTHTSIFLLNHLKLVERIESPLARFGGQ